MRTAIYSPYLDTFGGGEKYMLSIAEVLSLNNSVDVLLDRHLSTLGRDFLKDKLSKQFDLKLENVNFKDAPVGRGTSALQRFIFLKKYDLFFYLTDGSIFFPSAKKNILHIQSPLPGEVNNWWRKLKLNAWNLIIYNSSFTQMHSRNNWPIKSEIIYPPVEVDKIKPLKKKKYILTVGRFFGYLKDKKHEILIRSFKELYRTGKIEGWSLHLVGPAGTGDQEYLEHLQDLAEEVPIKFYPNLAYNDLVKLYGESMIYWHAAGFGEEDPVKMEHFGISTVEAMAGGCVPVVIGKGGQREIVENGKSGYLWEDPDGLIDLTLKLVKDENLLKLVSGKCIKRAKSFSKEIFKDKILEIIKV